MRGGRHHIQSGTSMPGFGRIGATPDRYLVEAILERHGRQLAPTTRRAR